MTGPAQGSQAVEGDPGAFQAYRDVIDDTEATVEALGKAIAELETLESKQIEKSYLLGMLHLRQALLSQKSTGDAAASEFAASKRHYDSVERREPGYKYIYCKHAELYLYTRNDAGLVSIARRLGAVSANERTRECKNALEQMAKRIASSGGGSVAKGIYRAALDAWRPYPAQLAERLGDLEDADGNRAEAQRWWRACAEKTSETGRAALCRKKLSGLGKLETLIEFLDARGDGCYLRKSSPADHLLVGCPIEGYELDDRLAKEADVLLAMLPSPGPAEGLPPALFLANSYPLDGGSLIDLFESDLAGLLRGQPGAKVVRKILENTPSNMGECAGAELELRADRTPFPNQFYFFCRKHSRRYALMVSLLATSKATLLEHTPHFLRWSNVPQHIRDNRVEGAPASR
ncbi:MAG: hypothetical protein V3T33_04905 [Myxococcota bacterium]